MSKDWYIEIIDARTGNARLTGKGAAFLTEAGAREAFKAARRLEVADGGFLVDLHDDKGDLLDTIRTDALGFRALTGERAKSVKAYEAHDDAYWRDQMQRHGSAS